MAQKTKSFRVNMPAKVGDSTHENETQPPEIVNFLSKVENFLQEGRPEEALELFSRNKLKSSWVTNANGVCLLRLDRAQQAVNLFRGLALSPGVVTLRTDAPNVFKTNFAAALLASNNVGGCLSVLHEINDEQNPVVQRLRAAIQLYRKRLPFWKRVQWLMGMPPDGSVTLDFPLGGLE